MQGANKRMGKLPKKPKLAADKSATNESATDDSATEEPPTDAPPTDEPPIDEPPINESPNEPTTLESINDPDTMKSLETSGEAPALASPIRGDETTSSRSHESDLPTISHTDGIAILDEYFPKSATDSRPLNSVVLDEVPTSVANAVCRDSPLVPLIQSHAPEALTAPPSAGSNAVSSKALGILDPKQAMGGFKMLTSTSNTGSPESVSSTTDLTSIPSSVVTHTPFARRLVLDDAVQLLEHVLVALEDVYDDSRIPNSSIAGVLDDILKTSNHTIFVKIMTSVTENWAKCNRLIAKPALEIAQERLRKVEQNSLNRSKEDRYQMNMTREDRIKSERLKHAIACLDARELSSMEL